MLETQIRVLGDAFWQPVETDGDPKWTDNDPGGYGEATVKLRNLTPYLRDNVQDGDLRIMGPRQPVFFGRIEAKPMPDGSLTAYGQQTWLDDLVRNSGSAGSQISHTWTGMGTYVFALDYSKASYCEADPSNIVEAPGPTTDISISKNANGIVFVLPAGSNVYTTSAFNSVVIPIGATAKCYARFGMKIAGGLGIGNPFEVTVSVYPARTVADPALLDWGGVYSNINSGFYSFNARGDYSGEGAFTSSEPVPFDALMVTVMVDSTSSTSVTVEDIGVTLTLSPGIFGVCATDNTTIIGANGASSAVNGDDVITDITSLLPDNVLPSGSAYQAFIQADNTPLGRFLHEAQDTYNDVIAKVLGLTGWRYGWWCRMVGGDWAPVPVYEPHSTTADYAATEDGRTVVAELHPGGIKDMCSITRVQYKGPSGDDCYRDVKDSDGSHLLVMDNITRVRQVSIDSHDPSVASSTGAVSNATYGRSTLPGTVTLTGPIVDTAGGTVEPCHIEAGKMLQFDSPRYGSTLARIISVSHEGRSKATLTLEDSPYSPKRLKRALRKGSVGNSGTVAGLA